MHRALLAFVLLFAATGGLHAEVILFQQIWDKNHAFGAKSNDGTNQQEVAEDFETTEEWEVTEVRWTGLYRRSVQIDPERLFRIRFFEEQSSLTPADSPFLDVLVEARRTSARDTVVSELRAYGFSARLPQPLDLQESKVYWISVRDAGPGTGSFLGMYWAGVNSITGVLYREGTAFRPRESFAWRFKDREGVAFTLVGLIPSALQSGLDIKPGSCPNSVNTSSRGVLPMAILGSDDFDVSEIDRSSLNIYGSKPLAVSIEDVSGPEGNSRACDCSGQAPDGIPDLVLHFRTEEIAWFLDLSLENEPQPLTLGGRLLDSRSFHATDCVVARVPGR